MAHLSRAARRALPVLLALYFVAGHAQAGGRVVLVTSGHDGAHGEMLDAVTTALAPEVAASDIDVHGPVSFEHARLNDARIIVAIGTRAAQAVGARRPPLPVLNTLLARDAHEAIAATAGGGNVTAVYLDQPEPRQIALLGVTMPDQVRIALLAGPDSGPRVQRLTAAAREQRLQVAVERVNGEGEIYPALERLLNDAPVLIALPDSTVYNSYTIQNILLTSYRNRAPLIGFSPAYVRAGALLALYSTPAQLGRQAADVVRGVLAGRAVPAAQGPRDFEVASNPVVARALGIALDAPDRIAARVRERELQRGPRP